MKSRQEERRKLKRALRTRRSSAAMCSITLSVTIVCIAACGGDDEPQGPQTRTVSKTGDGNFGSIQECISASSNQDTCLVYPGTYSETIDFQGKAITVRSSQGPEETKIDGQGRGTVVTFSRHEDDDSVLDGFTIMNGSVPWKDEYTEKEDTLEHGGGIEIISAAPVIQNCILLNNNAEGDGGGIYCFSTGSKPEIENVVFQGNTAGGQGGGLCAVYGRPKLNNCLFFENEAVVGGAISARHSARTVLESCTIADNSADQAWALYMLSATVKTINSIFWNHTPPGSQAVLMDLDPERGDTSFDLSYVDLQDGTDNIQPTETCSNNADRCCIIVIVDENEDCIPIQDVDDDDLRILTVDPLFVDGTEAFYLSQPPVQSTPNSCVDAGDRSAEDAGLEETTTRTDGVADEGTVDLGYHYPATM